MHQGHGFYIFMNPYAAGLISLESSWPWWLCPNPSLFRFTTLLHGDGKPPHEWLHEMKEATSRIIKS